MRLTIDRIIDNFVEKLYKMFGKTAVINIPRKRKDDSKYVWQATGEIGLSKSSVHRLLNCLHWKNFPRLVFVLIEDDTDGYKP